jgi:hypothetical protein
MPRASAAQRKFNPGSAANTCAISICRDKYQKQPAVTANLAAMNAAFSKLVLAAGLFSRAATLRLVPLIERLMAEATVKCKG